MSHVIHVLASTGGGGDEDRFRQSLLAAGRWRASETDLVYDNPDTGVVAALEPADPPVLPAAHASTGTALVINYLRPSFWPREVLPGFGDAVTNAGFAVLDPQSSEAAVAPDVGSMCRSWDAGNEAAVRATRRAGNSVPWISPSRATEWWTYQRALPQLRRGFAAHYYVPSLRLVRRADSSEVQRAMSWPDFVPALLPACDSVIFLRSDPVRRFEIRGVADAGEVRHRLAPLLHDVELNLLEPHRVTLVPEGRAEEAGRLLATTTLSQFADLVEVSPDALVDVPPEDRATGR